MRLRNGIFSSVTIAGVAQLAEQLICNQQVISSSLIAGSILAHAISIGCVGFRFQRKNGAVALDTIRGYHHSFTVAALKEGLWFGWRTDGANESEGSTKKNCAVFRGIVKKPIINGGYEPEMGRYYETEPR